MISNRLICDPKNSFQEKNPILMDRYFNKFWSEKLYRRALQAFGSRLFRDSDRDPGKSILVAGAARSGTTWLAELISTQIPCRLMFEPFNTDLVCEYREFKYFQYMRPGEHNETLYAFAQKVFNGEIRNHWIDRKNENLLPRFRLIKEIRANLLLKWLHDNFPGIPFLFIIRHPCAVVLSRMELGWATDRDIESFLTQQYLIDDHLSDHMELIRSSKSDEEKHAIIWCVSNLIPLKQFPPDDLRIIFYENLCLQPDEEFSKILQRIQQKDKPLTAIRADKPSTTSKISSAVVTGQDKISRWSNCLTTRQITKILNVVSEFGLSFLYDESLIPNR